MVDFKISSGLFPIADKITKKTQKNTDEKWFKEDIVILMSSELYSAEIKADFSYDIPVPVEYTLDGGDTWIKFNNGNDLIGGQSIPIRVSKGNRINFRAKKTGMLNRCLVS